MGKAPIAARSVSKSPKQPPVQADAPPADTKSQDAAANADSATNADTTKPLAPPPRPGQQQTENTPDYFTTQLSGSLSLEPNPFEQSFGGAPPETPGGTKLPSVAALTSPSSLLPGSGVTPFIWGAGSLRTGPLSPAMLSGPTNDYFSDTHHLRGGFPTPNESSLRTGLTPGGSGSMFPAASPNSQAIFNSLQSGGATPSTLDFHRTALSAAAAANKQRDQQASASQNITSQPQDIINGATSIKVESKAPSGPFDPHDNDAANGLFLLAQGRNGTQPAHGYAVAPQPQVHAHPAPLAVQPPNMSPQMNGGGSIGSVSARGMSEAGSAASDESEQARPVTRGKPNKRNSIPAAGGTTNGRRKAEEPPAKAPASKKAKTNGNAASSSAEPEMMSDMDDDDDNNPDNPRSKMTDEEKRKNFLERNRVAALKCRQRKKQWLANLQTKVEMFTSENDALSAQIAQLREEVVNLKTLLLAHKDCPVTQQQGLHSAFMQQAMEYTPQMNPYGMAAPMSNQAVIAGQGQRRFS